jgi:hypothetical protein
MHRFILYIVIMSLLAQACQENQSHEAGTRKNGFSTELKSKEDSLYHDVMEGHDIGMARIGKLKKYLGQVKQSLDSLQKLPAKKIDAHYRQALIDLQEDLNYADYSMNTWMVEFKADSGTGNPDLRLQYLQHEKEKVTKVKENILGSLQRADSLFKKN